MLNCKIREIEIHHPENLVTNEEYIEHFSKQGKSIENLLNAFGRKERYVIDSEDENTVTLGIEAAKKVLKKANLTGEDIDVIIFSSQFPEYTCPSQATIIHGAINGKLNAMVMDLNVNCVGMVVALDTASRHLATNPKFKRALIVGADHMSIHCREVDELTYPLFGDAGCAVIIEKCEEEEESGVLDIIYKTDGSEWGQVKYPCCGSSKTYKSHENDAKLDWIPFDGEFINEHGMESIRKLLKRNKLKVNDISMYCLSQYATGITRGIANGLGVPDEKALYVGDRYGYTGTSSPFLALHEAIKNGKVKKGDYLVLWSVGIFWTTAAILIKY